MINQREIINDLLDHLYEEFKVIVRSDTDMNYNAYVFKQPPEQPVLPNIQIAMFATPNDETLNKRETKWRIGIEVNVFAQDTGYFDRRTIAKELTELAFDFFYHDYGFDNTFDGEIPNLDARVHRQLLRFRGTYDTETGIIYRR